MGGKNTLACTVYYKLSNAESWVSAVTLTPSDYTISETNRLLSPAFDERSLSSAVVFICNQNRRI